MTVPLPKLPMPEIDAAAIRIHCEVVFSGLEGFAPIRLLAEKGIEGVKAVLPFVPVTSVAEVILQQAETAARNGRGVFVVPGSVGQNRRARAEDVIQSAVVLVDLDEGDIAGKLAHLEAHLGPATLVVASGGCTEEGQAKLHGYWRLTRRAEEAELARLVRLRTLIEQRVGGDSSFDSLHQPIRVAGTVHGKFGIYAPVGIIAHRPHVYDLDQIEALAGQMPNFPGVANRIDTGRRGRKGPLPTDLFMQSTRAGAVDDTTRFAAIGKVIGHWLHMVRSGRLSIEAARNRLEEYNAACIVPPWEGAKLEASFRSLLAKDVRSHGPMPDFDPLMAEPDSGDREGDGSAERPKAGPEAVPFSEDDLAQRFAERHRGRLRFAPSRGCWMIWTGQIWRPDDQNKVRDLIRKSCRVDAAQVNDLKIAVRLSSERTFSAVEKLVRADPAFATAENDWDNGPTVINTPAGVLDLETGEVQRHAPGDLFMRMAGASSVGTCPNWLRFLDEIAGNKEGLVAYLQRVAGYCLTGSMTEQVFFFLCGSGANGKSVFLAMLSHILGDYAATAALDTFTSTSGNRHPNDLAGIVKARIAVVTEIDHGRTWAEGRIKAITGGDRLRVRFLYREFFEAEPAFKILVAGNSRPRLTGVGEAMRRRLHLIPFDVTIPPEKRDKDLVTKLKAEKDGIFHWAVEGCRVWQSMGLAPPQCVSDAAESYFGDEDLITQWIDDRCITRSDAWAPSVDLFKSWKGWAEERGLEVGSQRSLGEELRARAFTAERRHKGRGWSGIAPRGGAPAS